MMALRSLHLIVVCVAVVAAARPVAQWHERRTLVTRFERDSRMPVCDVTVRDVIHEDVGRREIPRIAMTREARS